MSTVMTETANEPSTLAFQWNWRLAQQAFAQLIAYRGKASVMLTDKAIRSLSALSADERPAFERWLALQLINADEMSIARGLRSFRGIDTLLGVSVRCQLPRVAAELQIGRDMAVAA